MYSINNTEAKEELSGRQRLLSSHFEQHQSILFSLLPRCKAGGLCENDPHLLFRCWMLPRHLKWPFTMMAIRVHNASHSSILKDIVWNVCNETAGDSKSTLRPEKLWSLSEELWNLANLPLNKPQPPGHAMDGWDQFRCIARARKCFHCDLKATNIMRIICSTGRSSTDQSHAAWRLELPRQFGKLLNSLKSPGPSC